MKNKNIQSDKIICPKCGKPIPNQGSKCTNPDCETNKPLKS